MAFAEAAAAFRRRPMTSLRIYANLGACVLCLCTLMWALVAVLPTHLDVAENLANDRSAGIRVYSLGAIGGLVFSCGMLLAVGCFVRAIKLGKKSGWRTSRATPPHRR